MTATDIFGVEQRVTLSDEGDHLERFADYVVADLQETEGGDVSIRRYRDENIGGIFIVLSLFDTEGNPHMRPHATDVCFVTLRGKLDRDDMVQILDASFGHMGVTLRPHDPVPFAVRLYVPENSLCRDVHPSVRVIGYAGVFAEGVSSKQWRYPRTPRQQHNDEPIPQWMDEARYDNYRSYLEETEKIQALAEEIPAGTPLHVAREMLGRKIAKQYYPTQANDSWMITFIKPMVDRVLPQPKQLVREPAFEQAAILARRFKRQYGNSKPDDIALCEFFRERFEKALTLAGEPGMNLSRTLHYGAPKAEETLATLRQLYERLGGDRHGDTQH